MFRPDSFQPAPYLRNAYVQTILASNKVRARGGNPMVREARKMILDAGEGIRLLGFHSPQPQKSAKGLVIILHGWEGSVESTYMLRTGRHLYQHGYDIFRLDYRDHGESHHLNEGLFYAILLEEVFQSVKGAAQLAGRAPTFLVGFSLGGNFCLRIGRRCLQEPIDNLAHIVAISPLLDPDKTTDRVDSIPFIRRYFLKKWQRSLAKKQELFPSLYDFSHLASETSIRGMTDVLLSRHSNYGSAKEYFKGYTLLGSAIKHIRIPITLLASEDDPIIPVGDFHELETNERTNLAIQRYGGHNGFIDGLFLRSWYETKMVELFDSILEDGYS
jgi:predicted alpha/beta-fold hydrolase